MFNMNKIRLVSVVLVVLFSFIALVGCGSSQNATQPAQTKENGTQAATVEPTKAKEKKIIAFLLVEKTQKRYPGADIPSFEARAKELGYTPIVQTAEGDSAKQISEVESVLLQGAGAIVIQPINFQAAGKIVQMAAAENVPVIAYNDVIKDAPIKGYVGRDSSKLGAESAKKMMTLYTKGNYIIAGGDEGAGVARDMVEAYHKVLKDNPDIKIVSDQFNKGWAAEGALKQAEGALIANKDNIQAILACNDGLATGALQALSSVGLTGKVGLSGQDLELPAAKAIIAGKMSFTAFTEYGQMAKDAVDMAVAIMQGKELPKHSTINNGAGDIPWVETPVIFVTKDNMGEFLKNHSWWLKVEEVYADVPKDQWPK